VVAIVGAWLNLNYHSEDAGDPKTPIVVHGLAAVIGYVCCCSPSWRSPRRGSRRRGLAGRGLAAILRRLQIGVRRSNAE
jgi:hypothetical protein